MEPNENFSREENGINIINEIKYYIFFWPWFVFSFVFIFSSSFIYLRYSSDKFSTSAILQVKDAKSDPSSFLTQSAGAMFNFNRVKLDNYISQIGSKSNFSQVVDLLDLQTQVYSFGRIKSSLLFDDQIPFKVNFTSDKVYSDGITLIIEESNNSVEFNGKKYNLGNGNFFEYDDFNIEIFEFPIQDAKMEYLITRSSHDSALNSLASSILVSPSTKEGDNIILNIIGLNINRNEAIINSLIDVAHKNQVKEKREIYDLSISFINSRLVSIINEIDSLSLETTGFKSKNLIFSPKDQTANALSSLNELEQENFDLTTQLELAKSLKYNLNSQSDFSLLPSNIGISSGNVNELVVKYNSIVIKRNQLLSGATLQNPVVIQLSLQLTTLKQNILSSIDNYLKNIETSLLKYKEFKSTTNNQVSRIPELEARLLEFQRKFELSENLYLFLLQRREEASISYEATLPNTRIINSANTNPTPVSPKRQVIYLGCLILGILLPFSILYILKNLDTKLHTREDLQELAPNMSILGEVPFNEDIKSIFESRSVFAESSRVIRSNIDFKINKTKDCNVILCTSSIKSEGKTVSAVNIASSYVAAGRKVLLIGADLRNPQLHNVLKIDRKTTSIGLSNLIFDPAISTNKNLIQTFDVFNNKLDVLFSGIIPPNPAELLNSDRFVNILHTYKSSYDYIIIDSAPLLLVSDTYPLLKNCDLTIFTTRSGFTDKKIIAFINGLVEDKKVDNIALILNAVKLGPRSYYKYGYSYRYSYQYKYNYGYGYGYGEDKS